MFTMTQCSGLLVVALSCSMRLARNTSAVRYDMYLLAAASGTALLYAYVLHVQPPCSYTTTHVLLISSVSAHTAPAMHSYILFHYTICTYTHCACTLQDFAAVQFQEGAEGALTGVTGVLSGATANSQAALFAAMTHMASALLLVSLYE
jgi:hypothetical protein